MYTDTKAVNEANRTWQATPWKKILSGQKPLKKLYTPPGLSNLGNKLCNLRCSIQSSLYVSKNIASYR